MLISEKLKEELMSSSFFLFFFLFFFLYKLSDPSDNESPLKPEQSNAIEKEDGKGKS